jgi:hypothetical protein
MLVGHAAELAGAVPCPAQTPVEAEAALRREARRRGVTLVEHEKAMARARSGLARLDRALAVARDRGVLWEFNARFQFLRQTAEPRLRRGPRKAQGRNRQKDRPNRRRPVARLAWHCRCGSSGGQGTPAIGAGTTHAWADVYVPGFGKGRNGGRSAMSGAWLVIVLGIFICPWNIA